MLICGSRDWCDVRPIFALVKALAPGSTVIVGGAKGADHLAEVYARQRDDLTVRVFPADWQANGKAAGFIRNRQMLDEEPDRVVAFRRLRSKGTSHTITEAERRGIPVEVHDDDRPKIRPQDVLWIEDGDESP